MRSPVSVLVGALLVVGCAGDDGGGDTGLTTTVGTAPTTTSAGTDGTGSGSDGTTGSASDSDSASTTGASDSDSDTATTGAGSTGGVGDDVCARWNADRADMSEGSWSGNAGSCDPGDISADGRANALKILNLYRWLADLPPVTTSPDRDAKAQACALMMHAAGSLSHTPDAGWPCYTADGAEGAGSSNISPSPGVTSVDLYVADPGNATTLGHRRWILSNSLGPTGLGSTSEYSCMWTLYGDGDAGHPWQAWPAPGEFPVEAVTASWASLDETGWSIQTDDIDLGGAQVSITRGGQDLPVSVTQLQGGFGSQYAISMIPQGWTTDVGSYHVEVTGISTPISYDIEVVSCG